MNTSVMLARNLEFGIEFKPSRRRDQTRAFYSTVPPSVRCLQAARESQVEVRRTELRYILPGVDRSDTEQGSPTSQPRPLGRHDDEARWRNQPTGVRVNLSLRPECRTSARGFPSLLPDIGEAPTEIADFIDR
jgi:hypothetical protein